jgi:hypothetical protein
LEQAARLSTAILQSYYLAVLLSYYLDSDHNAP